MFLRGDKYAIDKIPLNKLLGDGGGRNYQHT